MYMFDVNEDIEFLELKINAYYSNKYVDVLGWVKLIASKYHSLVQHVHQYRQNKNVNILSALV